MVVGREILVVGHSNLPRWVSLVAAEAVVAPELTELTCLEDLRVRISRRLEKGEGQQILAVAVKDRVVASVLV